MEKTIFAENQGFVSNKIKEFIFDFSCYAFIILFVYTATSKILIINLNRVIWGLLPVIGKFNSLLVYVVPGVEIFVSVLLLIPKTKWVGLWSAVILMMLFTGYIGLMLTTASNLPCTCGGIIESLSWSQHLYFNIAFLILGILGIISKNAHKN